jgi:hypothetical protein
MFFEQPKLFIAQHPAWSFWFICSEMAEAEGNAFLQWCATSWDVRTLQRRWLDALSRGMDGYLRSEAFLECAQQGIERMTMLVDSRKEADPPLGEISKGESLP